MARFIEWCNSENTAVGAYSFTVLTGNPANLAVGVQATSAVVPGHYVSGERVARALRRLGRPNAAAMIEEKLPTTKSIRSGDLGEILATEWMNEHGNGYRAPIKRLRWKDHRNMAMRGEDVIGLLVDPETQRLHFLKGEAKSRVALTGQVLSEARAGLDKENGLPSQHALSFIADRLSEMGDEVLADAIDDAQWRHGIAPQNVRHLLFTFSGNAPGRLLSESLRTYTGATSQLYVGLRIEGHAAFVQAVYEQVIANANDA